MLMLAAPSVRSVWHGSLSADTQAEIGYCHPIFQDTVYSFTFSLSSLHSPRRTRWLAHYVQAVMCWFQEFLGRWCRAHSFRHGLPRWS